jgi:DNA-directed RNA polymerase specialized sigma24 family protein
MPEPPAETHPPASADADAAHLAGPSTDDVPLLAAGVFEAVCENHVDFVWRFAACRGVEPAALEHVVHKVFGVLHGRLVSLEDPGELRVSLAGITRNVVRGYLRQLGDHSPLEPVPRDAAPLPLSLVDLAQKTPGELCNFVLGKMNETEREVFILCEMEGFTLFESAEALHIGESTLRARLEDACKIFNVAAAELRAQKFWQARDPLKP